ncbi:MAG TPA: TonB family protein [Chitinophagaceae bacterium]|nr:TonB family protein [Chitinophagaceae bacterium]
MTNSNILQSDLLDIIFENRNKEYGAYSLRRGYSNRMLTALGAGLLLLVIFILTTAMGKSKEEKKPVTVPKEEMVIRTIQMPAEKIKEPVKPKETVKQKPVPKTATVKYTTPPVIKKDKEVTTPMVAAKELDGKKIDDKTSEGKPADNKVVIIDKPVDSPGTGTQPAGPSQPDFVADERDPEFPGGAAALKQFLSRNLDTPDDLESGEKKVVRIKFQVDKDGMVNSFEIVTSGGNEFDQEVVRVCKKMPRWTPAKQNGISVPVNYVLPVTFIGIE